MTFPVEISRYSTKSSDLFAMALCSAGFFGWCFASLKLFLRRIFIVALIKHRTGDFPEEPSSRSTRHWVRCSRIMLRDFWAYRRVGFSPGASSLSGCPILIEAFAPAVFGVAGKLSN
jgi:hypothetical protein